MTTVIGDATAMAFDDDSFDSAGCFTMLHHVKSTAAQNQRLAEVLRVLRPGGVLIGYDSLPSDACHQFHEADTYNPVEPGTLIVRLQTIGFDRITVSVGGRLKFIAHKPTNDPAPKVDQQRPAQMVVEMVDHVLGLVETWPLWDELPIEVPVEGEGSPRVYTPHKAIRRVADHLIDHLAEIEARVEWAAYRAGQMARGNDHHAFGPCKVHC